MPPRTSKVSLLNIQSVFDSSILQIGDSRDLDARSWVLAIQREGELFLEQDHAMEADYSRPPFFFPAIRPISFRGKNVCGRIEVGRLDILGVSSSSVIQIGTCKNIFLGNRTKHIRQLSGIHKMPSK